MIALSLALAGSFTAAQEQERPAAPAPAPAESTNPGKTWCVVIVGLPGDDSHVPLFDQTSAAWLEWFAKTLDVPAERLFLCRGEMASEPARPATKASLAALFGELQTSMAADDTVWVLTLGHGHGDARRAWLHVPGPDPDAADFARWLNALPARRQLVWLTQATSGYWLKPLGKPGRIVITATEADREENETEFPHALATVVAKPAAHCDLNGDQRVTLLELLRATVRETVARFESDQRLPTEHAQLDDNGDGTGVELAPAAKAAADTPKPDAPKQDTSRPDSPKPDASSSRPPDGAVASEWTLIMLPPP